MDRGQVIDDGGRPVVSGTTEPASVNPSVSDDTALPILSKKAIKKAAKAERFAAYKLERKAREKEARKEKKKQIAAKRAAGELDEEEEVERNKCNKRPRLRFGGKVVVDLGFDEMMTEKEIISVCSQLTYTYSANRRASYPFSLVYTSLNGRIFTRLESMNDAGYKRWTNTEWWHEGYERLWLRGPLGPSQDGEKTDAPRNLVEGSDEATVNRDCDPSDSRGSKQREVTQQNVIYLTADSEEELTDLKANETYIIGGICDHNRYKNLCLDKAKESGIRSARLPIGRYLASLPTRKVLTVNQVFEILLKWVETRDWEEALHSVIPKRKFQAKSKDKSDPVKEEILGGDEGNDTDGEEDERGQHSEPIAVEVLEQNVDEDGNR